VLLYHRVGDDGPAPHQVVPAVPTAVFRRHLEALAEIGDVVSLDDLLPTAVTDRIRFAITFDDDYQGHVDAALPVLVGGGVPATFFLSGRALSGDTPYWWVALEQAIARRGLAPVAAEVGVAAATPAELAARCQGTPLAQRWLDSASGPGDLLSAEGITTLARAGMTVGFHTLDHPVLPQLKSNDLHAAVVDGCELLRATAGQEVDLFAYPHGRADARVAASVEAAGYRAAFTGMPRPVRSDAHPFLLGRWEAGALPPRHLQSETALRLQLRPGALRPAPAGGASAGARTG
jgi:peptidoglycan/xylan/chitin deacetylase (PgdA/CDA1 family)